MDNSYLREDCASDFFGDAMKLQLQNHVLSFAPLLQSDLEFLLRNTIVLAKPCYYFFTFFSFSLNHCSHIRIFFLLLNFYSSLVLLYNHHVF